MAVGSVAATEVETMEAKVEQPKHEEKTVHSLLEVQIPETAVPEESQTLPTDSSEESKTSKSEEEPKTIDEDDTPLFDTAIETAPIFPILETPLTTPHDDDHPVVKVFDNPFSTSSNDDEGFEITSRIITQEEVQARTEQEIAVLESKKAKEADPKEQLKKQRLRALSINFRTARGLEELENQPAYLRRNVEINQSDEDDLSHYSTSQTGISSENSFLHDNVD